MQTDINADGFADHVIERIDEVMGSGFEQEIAVFAPGTASNKTSPQGNIQLDANFRSFFTDIARWMNDDTYFANNINTLQIPIFGVGFLCSSMGWSATIYGFLDGDLCFPYVYIVGYQTVQYGVNFSALSASTYMDNIATAGGEPSENALWQI